MVRAKETLMKPDVASRYHARMQRVLIYIDEHLDGDLNLDLLSDIAAFSKYHFHRQFSSLFGISIHRYVQLLRLKRASSRLAFASDPVLEVALDSGYAGPEAFARAFKLHYNQSPRSFRNSPQWTHWHETYLSLNRARSAIMQPAFTDNDVRIIQFPETPVAILTHQGDPRLIGDTIRQFIGWRRANGLPPKKSATFNLLHTDPETTEPADFRLDLCAATDRRVDTNDAGVVAGVIPAGRCAVLRLIGANDDLRPAVNYLYAEWLLRSGLELRDHPMFAQRVSFYPDVPEHEAVTDIFLPLAG
jgi:AraC family transcriptional regulator